MDPLNLHAKYELQNRAMRDQCLNHLINQVTHPFARAIDVACDGCHSGHSESVEVQQELFIEVKRHDEWVCTDCVNISEE
jgi:hypothetical protein